MSFVRPAVNHFDCNTVTSKLTSWMKLCSKSVLQRRSIDSHVSFQDATLIFYRCLKLNYIEKLTHSIQSQSYKIAKKYKTSSFLLSFTRWHVPPSRTSAEACLAGWPNAQPQGYDRCSVARHHQACLTVCVVCVWSVDAARPLSFLVMDSACLQPGQSPPERAVCLRAKERKGGVGEALSMQHKVGRPREFTSYSPTF